MNKILIILVILVILIFSTSLVISCGNDNNGGIKAKLEDEEWVLTAYGEKGRLKSIIDGTEITAIFERAKGQVSGSAGCNFYGARYEIEANKLTLYELAYTQMLCLSPEGVMEQEQEFLSILGKAESFETGKSTLTIFCTGGLQLNFVSATN